MSETAMKKPAGQRANPNYSSLAAQQHHSTDVVSYPLMTVTIWKDVKGSRREERDTTWPQFCDWLESLPPAPVKDKSQLIKLATFGDERTLKGALRHDDNVLEVNGIEGDYDDEVMTPEAAIEKLEAAGVRALIAPTYTSTPEKPRWRVLAPLGSPVAPSERLKYLEALNGILGGVLANESATLSQSYYVGVPPGANYNVIHTFGDPSQGSTLDGLEMMDGIEHLRASVSVSRKERAAVSDDADKSFSFDESGYEDWIDELLTGDSVHPAMTRLVGRWVAKGLDNSAIYMLMRGAKPKVAAARGAERAEEMVGDELDRAIAGARAKGFAPKSYHEVMEAAQALDKDAAPDKISAVVTDARPLGSIEQRRILDTVKKQTGLPLGALKDQMRSDAQAEGEDELSELELALGLADEIGRDSVLAAQGFVWEWQPRGVWQKLEERSVKQRTQSYIGDKLESVRKSNVDSVADLFRTEVYKERHEFDVGPPDCVNTPNGELTLNPIGWWDLEPHNREHYRTTQVPAEYDRNATAPTFLRFMDDVFKGDSDSDEKRRALLEMIGYSLMAHCEHEKFIILVGSGGNGKSVLLSVLEGVLGDENVAGVQPSQFGRSFQRAHLHGKLANIVTEVREGEVIDDAALKGIVSGEPTTVEHKFQDPFVMRPFATCWFGTNHMPHTRDFSDALFRRALVVEFNNKFKPELGNCDPGLPKKLLAEMPGILNLALEAYLNAVESGFTVPASSRDACNRWRIEADQVAQFVEMDCEGDSTGQIPPQKLYNAYRGWAQDNGIHKMLGQRQFLNRLTLLGYGRAKRNGVRYITGLKCERTYLAFEKWD